MAAPPSGPSAPPAPPRLRPACDRGRASLGFPPRRGRARLDRSSAKAVDRWSAVLRPSSVSGSALLLGQFDEVLAQTAQLAFCAQTMFSLRTPPRGT